jgi:hypothetical protein
MLQALTVVCWVLFFGVATISVLVTLFTSRHGLRVTWGLGRYDRERRHLRILAHSEDPTVARPARLLLRADFVALLLIFPLLPTLLTCMLLR